MKATFAAPRPFAGAKPVIHDTSDDTLHEHSASVAMAICAAPPLGGSASDGGAMEIAHLTGVGATDVVVVEPHAAAANDAARATTTPVFEAAASVVTCEWLMDMRTTRP